MILQISLLILLSILSMGKSEYQAEILNSNATSMQFRLNYTGKQEYYINPKSPIIKQLLFQIDCITYQDLQFKITDFNRTRFQIPQGGKFPIDPLKNFSYPINLSAFDISVTLKPFEFKITRKSTKFILFSTTGEDLIFSQHYIQIGGKMGSSQVYGLGQRFVQSFRVKPGVWTIFNRDRGQKIDKGTGLQTYGSFPMYMCREKTERLFHLNYFRNSNAMDVLVQTNKDDQTSMVFKTIGGIIDFRLFLGQKSPEELVEKFHKYLGGSLIPPFWALGYHQSRYGYKNITALQTVVQKFDQYSLPLDTIWLDIDYLVGFEDFTIDEQKFPLDRLAKLIQKVHFVPIIEAGIKVTNNTYYKEGKKRNVYVKDAAAVEDFIGRVRGGDTVFVDFFHPNASGYWSDMLQILQQKVNYSGLWLDMNEYTNYCDGPCSPPPPYQKSFDYSNDLPYNPGADVIETDTLSLNSTHYQGVQEADVHNYAALLQTEATYQFLLQTTNYPFILTRSSTLGSSKYGFHWSGDNQATFDFLKLSIADNFNNQMWGFQMVGADICAYSKNVTEQLCARWYQLGSLYPFSRNHNNIRANDQQPYAMGKMLLSSASQNLGLRYIMLKWYYSLFIYKKGYGTIFRPPFFQFPEIQDFYKDQFADTQFMLNSELMVTPILKQGALTREICLKGTNWYDLINGKFYANGIYQYTNHPTHTVPIFLREGAIVSFNHSPGKRIKNTLDLNSEFVLIVGLKQIDRKAETQVKKYSASGRLMSIQDYNNQSKITECLKEGCFYYFDAQLQLFPQNQVTGLTHQEPQYKNLTLNVKHRGSQKLAESLKLVRVRVYWQNQYADALIDVDVKGNGTHVIPIKFQSNSSLSDE